MKDHTVRDPELMLLRFDSYEGGIAEGELKTLFHPSPFCFHSLAQLILIMDDLLDVMNFPKETGEFRSLNKKDKEQVPFSVSRSVSCSDVLLGRWERNRERTGFHGQMEVLIRRREHSSMQGSVNLKGEMTQFRSTLELLHMLYEYLEEKNGICSEKS